MGQGCPWGAQVSRGRWPLADTEAVTGHSGPTCGQVRPAGRGLEGSAAGWSPEQEEVWGLLELAGVSGKVGSMQAFLRLSSPLLGDGFSPRAPPLWSVGLPPLASNSHPSRSEPVLEPPASESWGGCFGPLPADVPTGVRVRSGSGSSELRSRGWCRRPPLPRGGGAAFLQRGPGVRFSGFAFTPPHPFLTLCPSPPFSTTLQPRQPLPTIPVQALCGQGAPRGSQAGAGRAARGP